MNRQQYLKKFSGAVRWRLSGEEAEDIIADYEEMLDETGEALEEKWGHPEKAAKLLGNATLYYKWIIAFGVLTGFLLISELPILFWRVYSISYFRTYGVLLIGIVLALIAFRPNERKRLRPKGVLPLVGLLFLLYSAEVYLVMVTILQVMEGKPVLLDGKFIVALLKIGGVVSLVVGVCALVGARIKTYHWRTLYVVCLMGSILCLSIAVVLSNMDLHFSGIHLMQEIFINWCSYVGIGLVGVALCLKNI